ncbi:DeoR/GlpR family DNA-binding transcription regulator [Mucilaginibacter antarcticus]|uniref:DeoR/GlpR family DNA-binding transcription regulator n=1 Tax=Mucilaginibacter antarcticus TaxID=1855725 RepID=A0ABW5XK97_9SPHI
MSNPTERHQYILNQIQQKGNVNVLDLCSELEVSSVTIRKDLKLLEDKNFLFRTHGGATQSNPYATDRPVNEKEKLQSAEKLKIGAAAAKLIQPDDSILIASGTTVLSLARSIQPIGNLIVITSALNVALELINHQNIEVLQLGGILRKSSSSVIGPYAERILADFFCSKFFLGIDGIDLEFGLTTTSAMEAHLNRQMMAVSQKTIVIADSTKFGKRGFGKICGMDEIDEIITDNGLAPHLVEQLEAMGVKVTLV